jgi:prepilin-type N-terminal cleavage/methylation domain-containing protein
MNRRGMTLIELLVSLTIVAILANFALPAYSALKRRAEATRVIADVSAVRVAALDHYAEFGTFPPTHNWGQAPTFMIRSLPQGFEWRYKNVEYRWERWSLPNGMPLDPSTTVLMGLSVRAPDPQFIAALRALYKGEVAFGSSTQITFVIE